jgi:diaminohydroxyphosphoribosylaminopyrimidine deaminase/5-amino-6-(5-phosphoribosylamino)uracil reductase
MDDSADKKFMLEALGLARMGWGLTSPNPMVGAVIVSDGVIIGRGYHFKAGEPHAEINAFSDASRHNFEVKGATMYVTLEPCCTTGRTPPCTDAIVAAGIKRVVIGSLDPNVHHAGRGVEQLKAAGIEVLVGVEQNACSELNQPFFKWVVTGKPFVILKMAMTLDGKIATASGESKWITGSEARRRVQVLRRLCDAIMVGGETVRQDRPLLTVREPESWPRQPLRLIASRSMDDEEIAFFFPDGNAERVELESNEEWHSLLIRLGARNITCLLIEGGGELAAAAIDAGVVDKVEFHIAPKLLGGRDSRPVLGGNNPVSMEFARQLHNVKVTRYGEDIAVSGYLKE